MPSNNYSVVKNRLSENKEARKVLENSNHVPLEGLFDRECKLICALE